MDGGTKQFVLYGRVITHVFVIFLIGAITCANATSSSPDMDSASGDVVEFKSGQYTGSESSEFVEIVVITSGRSPTSPISVMVTTSERTATGSNVDFDSNPINITIKAGSMSGSGKIIIICDKMVEGIEMFDITLKSISPLVMIGDRNKSVVQINDSTVVVNFNQSSYGVMENDMITITVTLNQPSSKPFQLNVTFAGDYNGDTKIIDISAGVSMYPFHIDNPTSTKAECDKAFSISITSVTGCGVIIGSNNNSKVMIKYTGATVSLGQSQYLVVENSDTSSGNVILSRKASEDVIVEVTIGTGSATVGKDYAMSTALVFNVTIPTGSLSSSFGVDIIDDMIQEGNETFSISIRLLPSCLLLSLGTSSSTVTIIDDDVLKVRFKSDKYAGTESSGFVEVEVIISGGTSTSPISIIVTTGEQTATGKDFNTTPLNATIPAGDTKTKVRVAVTNDSIVEGNETFNINLNISTSLGPAITAGGKIKATGVIVDTTMLTVKFKSNQYDGTESSGFVEVAVIISGGTSTSPISVMVTTSEQTATDKDFSTTPLTATIPTGATNTTVRVTVKNDSIVEGNETFIINLNVPSSLGPGITAGSVSSATGIIIDSSRIGVRFTQTQYSGLESTRFVIIMLDLVGGTSASPFNVTVTPSEQSLPVSAQGGVDFSEDTMIATFNSGINTSNVRVSVKDDMIAGEGNETFKLSLTVPSSLNPAITSDHRNTATGVIIDTTMLMVEFKSDQFTGSESSGFVEVVVIISGGTSITLISVKLDIILDGKSAKDDDLSTESINLNFTAKEVDKTAKIPVKCDNMKENEETFYINLALTSNNPQVKVRTGRDRSEGRITDSTVVVNFKQSSYEVMEGNEEVVIEVILSQPSSKSFKVMISLTDDTAKGGEDYGGKSIAVDVPANNTSASFAINIINDDISECNESFIIAFKVQNLPCGVTSGNNNTCKVMIRDDDGAVLSFNKQEYSVEENITPLSVGLMLSRRTSKDVTVEVNITNGSAKAGIDYGKSSPLVTITAGMTSSSFDVDIINNMIRDGNKMFIIYTRLPVTCFTLPLTTDSNSALVTIVDDEVVRIQFASTKFNGSESSGEIIVVIVVTGATSSDNINIMISLLEETATNKDFSTASLTATIPAGATNTTVRVAVTNDSIVEGNETFNINLNVPSSLGPAIAAGSISSTTGIIIDSSRITVRFTQTQYSGLESTKFIIIMFELVGGTSANPFNVTVTPSEQSPVSAQGGVDFSEDTMIATFNSGVHTSNVRVSVIDDMIAGEGNETFKLSLTVPSSLNPAITSDDRSTATGVIIDTTMLVVEFESDQYNGSESSGFVEVVVIISGGTSTKPINIKLNIVTARQSAKGNDLISTKPINLKFAPKEVNKTAKILVKCDKRKETEETFRINLTLTGNNPQVRTGTNSAIGVINDSTVVVNFKQSSYEVMEDKGEVMIVIELSQPSSKPFEVTINLMNVTAEYGEDYSMDNTTVGIAAGEMLKSFTINIINDNITECEETFKLTLSVPTSVCGAVNKQPDSTEVTIKDNGTKLSFNKQKYSIDENATPLSVGLMLSRRTSKDVTVEVTITNGSAKADKDYVKSSPLVTITAGLTSSSFDVDIIDNMIQDGDKMFTITIRLISTCLPVTIDSATTTVTINDDEVLRVQFESTTFSGLESSGKILATIGITGGIPNTAVTIVISLSGINATGNDFNTTSLNATIPAGDTNTTVRVAVTDDNIIEGNETFIMSLTVPSSLAPGIVAGSQTSATGVIIDTTEINVRFSASQYVSSEAAGFVMVTLKLNRGTSASPFNVTVTPSEQSPVSAQGGVDFDTTPLTATFDSGKKMSSVSVPVIADDVVEGNETFNVTLNVSSSVNRGITAGGKYIAKVTITDSTVRAKITNNPISITVLEETTATLSCNATGSGPIRYKWRRVNGEISSDRAEGVNTSTLTISSVQQEDEDEYYCVASYGVVNGTNHSDISHNASITVYSYPKLQPIHLIYFVIAGDPFMLNCTATNDAESPNNLRFKWFQGSTEITNETLKWSITKLYRNTLTVTSQVIITNLTVDLHNGIYICMVDNNENETAVNQTTNIVVEIPTSITTHPQRVVEFNGLNVTLSCNATGSGDIRYQWRRANREISSDRVVGVNTSTLTISPVQQEDEDEYYCVASNGGLDGLLYNDTSHRAMVIVYGLPNLLQPSNRVYYVIAGYRFILNCNVTNDRQSPNEIEFTWYQDNKNITKLTQIIHDNSMYVSYLNIQQLDSDQHSGEYLCVAYNNPSANVTSSTTVIVEISDFTNSTITMFEAQSIDQSHYFSTVMLPSLDTFKKPISHLFVVVTTDQNVIPSQVPDDDLVSHSESVNMMYVTAVVYNMSGDQWEKEIVIGNKSNYTHDKSIYYNAPLDKELTYYTFVRAYAYSHNATSPRYASSGLSEPITAPPDASSSDDSGFGAMGPIIGIVIVLIIIIIAIIIVILVLIKYKKKYNKEPEPLSPNSKDDIPLQEKNLEKAMPIMDLKSFPVINLKEQQVKTSMGQPTTLFIEAKGNPMPEITWKKDGDPINHPLLQDGSLYIHSTTMSDEGSYTVTATSSQGESSETIELVVLNPQFVPSDANKKPIKVDRFAEHLAMLHANINKQFGDDYDSIVAPTEYTYHAAKLAINVNKNRYKNILAYDHSRVVLNLQDNSSGTDYINASVIDGYNEKRAYIACQGPMASTVADFWRMVWEQNVTTIVMVTNLSEEGKPKCHQYWPDKLNGSTTYGNISVTMLQEEVLAEYTIRNLSVKMIEASSEGKSINLEVKHFHFTVWPDHGVPKYATAILTFHKRVCKHHQRKRGSPLLVHCSAGVGRTGTFIAIDIELQRIKQEGVVDVYNTVYRMRSKRSFTVQTLAQYVFVFDALMESIMCGDNTIGAPTNVAKERLEELAKVNPATRRSGYEAQFQKLQAASPQEADFQYINANLPENRHKNRSMKNLPPDSSRVYLTGTNFYTDYICASYIDGYRHRKAFLATQGPMDSTLVEFWAMIWERKSHAIVMLSLLVENGKEVSVKYWPNKGDETMKVGPFTIETTSETEWDKYFVRRIMKVKMITGIKESAPRTISQFQYVAWPDHSAPSEASSIMDMAEVLEQVQRKTGNGPITVHCSDNMGRTGTFCALMMCHDRLKTEHMADVFYAIKTIRAQRPGMVENAEQYKFIHRTLIETMDRLATYSNF